MGTGFCKTIPLLQTVFLNGDSFVKRIPYKEHMHFPMYSMCPRDWNILLWISNKGVLVTEWIQHGGMDEGGRV